MDFPMNVDRMSIELSILYFDGSHWSKCINFDIFLSLKFVFIYQMSRGMRFPTMWYVRPAKAQTSLFRAFVSRLKILWLLSYWLSIIWSF